MKIKRENYNNIWFTSDWHYGHDRLFIYGYRGFRDIKEHDEFIVDNYNSLVSKNDLVFNLGDLLFGNKYDVERLMYKLNHGEMKFIRGNHDKALDEYLTGFSFKDLGNLKEITIIEDEIKYPITMCHFPMLSWNKSHHGAWNLCGHSHGSNPASLPSDLNGKRLEVSIDVGLKFSDRFMFSFEDVKQVMSRKQVTEHH